MRNSIPLSHRQREKPVVRILPSLMAYRRRQPVSRASTFKEDLCSTSNHFSPQISRVSTFIKDDYRSLRDDDSSSPSPASPSSSPSFSSQLIRSALRNTPLSSSPLSPANGDFSYKDPNRQCFNSSQQDSKPYEYTSTSSLGGPKYRFWGVLAKKAKSLLEDDNIDAILETSGRSKPQISPSTCDQEGWTTVKSRTADIISETHKLHIRRKGSVCDAGNQETNSSSPRQLPQNQLNQETQLKASRDVAMAMAAKAKLLLRELKTTKADLAFAKERCTQLEEENKVLRECREKGVSPEDDDLIRLQLETLLAEKSRLANENSIYARENRFLREVVEYHQLTMQNVVYLGEGIQEVTEVCPMACTGVSLDACPPTSPTRSGSSQNLTVLLDAPHPIPTKPTSPIAGTDVASPDMPVLASEDLNNCKCFTSSPPARS